MKTLLASIVLAGMMLSPDVARAQNPSRPSLGARKLVYRFQMTGYVGAVAFSPDGRLLAASSKCPGQLDARGRRVPYQSVIWYMGGRVRPENSFFHDAWRNQQPSVYGSSGFAFVECGRSF